MNGKGKTRALERRQLRRTLNRAVYSVKAAKISTGHRWKARGVVARDLRQLMVAEE